MNYFRLAFFAALFSGSCWANDLYDRTDAWEYENLTSYYTSSAYVETTGATFDGRDIFGGVFGSQEPNRGHYCFKDFYADSLMVTNFIEIETRTVIPLTGFRFAGGADGGILRMASSVTLKGFINNEWQVLDTFTPIYIPGTTADHTGTICDTNRPLGSMFVGKKFAFEVVNYPGNSGPRIIEIDATTAPNNPPLLDVSSPSDESTFQYPAEIPIAYTSSDPQGIERVEVIADNEVLMVGEAAGNMVWTNAIPGNHQIRVKAIDKWGAETERFLNIIVEDNTSTELKINSPQKVGEEFKFSLSGYASGNTLYIWSSSDLKNWTEVTNFVPLDVTADFSAPMDALTHYFYKAEARP